MPQPHIDPDLAAAFKAFESYEADWVAGDPDDLRRVYNTARAKLAGDAAPDCSVVPFGGPDHPSGLKFTPATRTADDAAIVYFHGGSWCVGSPETHSVPCSHLAVLSGLPVWSVDYRLAPEHPFPAQRDDGVAVVRALLEDGLGEAPPRRIFLAGDSAGAAVSFWTEMALPEALRARLAGVAGFYGGYGGGLSRTAAEDDSDVGTGLSSTEILAAYSRLGHPDHLRATPGFIIRDAVRAEGPPCLISAAECDPLLEDSRDLAGHLQRIGRPVTLDVAGGMLHSYLHYVARSAAAKAGLQRAADWIKAQL